jgi:hypothetical protein
VLTRQRALDNADRVTGSAAVGKAELAVIYVHRGPTLLLMLGPKVNAKGADLVSFSRAEEVVIRLQF